MKYGNYTWPWATNNNKYHDALLFSNILVSAVIGITLESSTINLASIYLLKVDNTNTKTRREICSKLMNMCSMPLASFGCFYC